MAPYLKCLFACCLVLCCIWEAVAVTSPNVINQEDSQQRIVENGKVGDGESEGMPVTTRDPGGTTELGVSSGVGVSTIIIGTFVICSIGLFIMIGILVCRYWMKTSSFGNSPVVNESAREPLYKKGRHQRQLDRYNRVKLGSVNGKSSAIDMKGDADIPADHYFSDVMHSDGVTIIRACLDLEQEPEPEPEPDYNNNLCESELPILSSTQNETSMTNELVSLGSSRFE